jgi:isochorismate hydrolase
MSTHGVMTKSPIALAREALAVAQQALEPYSSARSRHDFTQHQLFAILCLRQFFKTDYRGMSTLVEDFSDLRATLGLKKTPHFTTLQKAEQRLIKKGLSSTLWTPSLSAPASGG